MGKPLPHRTPLTGRLTVINATDQRRSAIQLPSAPPRALDVLDIQDYGRTPSDADRPEVSRLRRQLSANRKTISDAIARIAELMRAELGND